MYSLKIFFINLTFLTFSNVFSQNLDSTIIKNNLSLDISTGINYKGYYILKNYQNFNFHPFKTRVLYSTKRLNFGLGYKLQNVKRDGSKPYIPNNLLTQQLYLELEYFPIILNEYKIGVNVGYGRYLDHKNSYFDNGRTVECGIIGLYKLTDQFEVIITPSFELNYFLTNNYIVPFGGNKPPVEHRIHSKFLLLDIGVRLNPSFKTKKEIQKVDSLNRLKIGFQFGFAVLGLQKVDYYYDKDDPYYKNAFYFRKIAYPVFILLYKTYNNNLHSLGFGYRNSSNSEPNSRHIFNMDVRITDFKSYYKFDYSFNKLPIIKKTSVLAPYIGIQALYNYKEFSVKDSEPFYGGTSSYDITIKNNSNLLLLQFSPSIKYFNRNVFLDLCLNVNISGITMGNYNYVHNFYTWVSKDSIIVNKRYSSYLFTDKLFKNNFFYNDICFKVGYIF